jgi:NADP-dependent 3-hydroxy acid dehydrogenase YdfG
MDKVVLVTGASAGIGMATASALAGAGWTVVGASRRGTAADGWSGLMMDVDDDQSVSHGVASVLDRHGRLDALVTCAGWGLAGPVELTPIADAKAQEETNFWGSVRAVQAVLPAMRESGSGRIILISSIGGVLGLPFQAFYSASTLVEPGNIRTEFTAKRRSVPAPVTGDAPQGPYDQAALKALSVMERDEQNGAPAKDVAAVIRKVLDARRPPRRVSVGKPSERIGVVAKKLLPFRVFEMAAKGSLGV